MAASTHANSSAEAVKGDEEADFGAGAAGAAGALEMAAPLPKSLDDKLDNAMPPTEFPDGGLAAWSVVVGTFCAIFASFGTINSFGTYVAIYRDRFPDVSSGAITMIGALQIWGIFAVGSVVGRPFDNGYMRHTILFGSVLFTACFIATSFATQYWQALLAQGLGLGIAMGCLFVPSISCIGHWFRKRRMTALGIGTSGSALGAIAIPIQTRAMLARVGFAWTVRTSALICAALLLAANVLLRTRLPPKRDGRIFDFGILSRDRAFRIYCVSNIFAFLGIYTPLFLLARFALDAGIDADLAFYSIAIASAGSFVGRLLPLWLADTVGLLNVLIPATALCIPLNFIWLACTGGPSLIVFALLYGFFSGLYLSGNMAGNAVFCDDMRRIGTYNGLAVFSVSWAGLAGSPIASAIAQRSYAGAAGFSGGCLAIGVVLMIWARHLHVVKTGRRRT